MIKAEIIIILNFILNILHSNFQAQSVFATNASFPKIYSLTLCVIEIQTETCSTYNSTILNFLTFVFSLHVAIINLFLFTHHEQLYV